MFFCLFLKFLLKQIAFLFGNRPISAAPEENKAINESVSSFARGKLDENSFRSILKRNNIDPDLYQVINFKKNLIFKLVKKFYFKINT